MRKKSFAGFAIFLFLLGLSRLASAAPITLESFSAGFDDPGYYGGVAQLSVDGVDYSLNTRGFNFIVIDQSSGAVLDQISFDTHYSSQESTSMATFINSIDPGRIVLSAVKDEASRYLNSNALSALYTLGVNGNPLSYRSSWAFIGTKESSPGSAIEAFASRGSGPVSVTTTINTVPVPGSLFLLGAGLIWLVNIKSKRQEKRTAV
nr:interleukin-like EMT inducer domain-containing protein [uncultured Desulfobacter sp.]